MENIVICEGFDKEKCPKQCRWNYNGKGKRNVPSFFFKTMGTRYRITCPYRNIQVFKHKETLVDIMKKILKKDKK
ncbi:MAG TPA: hypothetical protein DCY00_06795 [Actinobacteria bacterium]|nr:hypothetical protein [Actinomycetota bacterium]